jgi:hypothetical protein
MNDGYVRCHTVHAGKNTTAHFFRMTVGTAAVMFSPFKCPHYECHSYTKLYASCPCMQVPQGCMWTLKLVFKCQCTGEASLVCTC